MYAPTDFGPYFSHARAILAPEIGNINSLLEHAATNYPNDEVFSVTITISYHLCLTCAPALSLLIKVSELITNASLVLQGRYRDVLGSILEWQNDYAEAAKAYTLAHGLFLEADELEKAALCLCPLGGIYRVQRNFEDATATLTQALDELGKMDSRRGTHAFCLQGLDEILISQENHAEAIPIYTQARDLFIDFNRSQPAAFCLYRIGECLRMQANHAEAESALRQAHDVLVEVDEHVGAARCLV